MSGRQTNGPIRDQRGADVMQFPSIIHPYIRPCEKTEPLGDGGWGREGGCRQPLLNRATGDSGWVVVVRGWMGG